MAKKSTKGTKSPIRRGHIPPPSDGSLFLKFEPGAAVNLVPQTGMEDMLSIDQCAIWLDGGNSPVFPSIQGTGEQCPGIQLGLKPRFRGFLPVVVKNPETDTLESRIFSFGIQVARQLSEIEDSIGEPLLGKVLRVKRTGEGLSTKYMTTYTGKTQDVSTFEMPDIETEIGPTTRPEILQLLFDAGVDISGILTGEEAEEYGASSSEVPFDDEDEGDDEWSDL